MTTKRLLVSRWMTPMPHAIEPHETIGVAIQRMRALKVDHLPVRAAGRVVGILSDRDILAARSRVGFDADKTSVAEVMTEDPYTVSETAFVAEVARVMADRKYGAVLIVDPTEHLLGIFTTTDALDALAALSAP